MLCTRPIFYVVFISPRLAHQSNTTQLDCQEQDNKSLTPCLTVSSITRFPFRSKPGDGRFHLSVQTAELSCRLADNFVFSRLLRRRVPVTLNVRVSRGW